MSRDARGSGAPRATRSGFGKVVVSLYAVFAVGATSRAVFQITTKVDEAPLAYTLSAVAAVVYVVAAVSLVVDRPWARRTAWAALTFEAAGVLGIGTFSLLRRDLFPEPTVWSDYGLGYLLIPLWLPFLGLWWLRRTRTTATPSRMTRPSSED